MQVSLQRQGEETPSDKNRRLLIWLQSTQTYFPPGQNYLSFFLQSTSVTQISPPKLLHIVLLSHVPTATLEVFPKQVFYLNMAFEFQKRTNTTAVCYHYCVCVHVSERERKGELKEWSIHVYVPDLRRKNWERGNTVFLSKAHTFK